MPAKLPGGDGSLPNPRGDFRPMILNPTLQDVVLRLLLTMLAGGLVGFNREVHGHSAGLRTTILVGLSACAAMALANILLSTTGKAPDSFVNIDVMRLPLGILTGVGFIGGGSILRRGNLVTGVTTAATLWAITAIGLCFGIGQFALGAIVTALTFITIWLLRRLENRIPREHRATLVVSGGSVVEVPDLSSLLASTGSHVRFAGARSQSPNGPATFAYEVSWRSADNVRPPIDIIGIVAARYRVESFELATESGHET
jgi:putative Mg2+ transporter-C (MgtC) family protein